ncbi:MAG: TonB-dependent receptor plug domain-containing protein, partial [Bacteroidota bacterium]
MRPKFHLIFTKFTSVLVLLLAMTSFAVAQKTVSGVVTDAETGEPLIAASVSVKGTTQGVSTGLDGDYSIDVEGDAVLVFSYIGYSEQEIRVGDQTEINVALNEGEDLDEVVVVGYGTVKREDVTGSITTITSKDFNQGVISSPEQLLQGRAAGVQVTTNSGEPGGGINIRIRGTSSVRSGNNPLFVVDGVPLSGSNISSGGQDVGAGESSARNPLNFLNPADIESIDILKDASATAIYGSRGANGVVIITTKSGDGLGSGITYTGSVSLSNITQKY